MMRIYISYRSSDSVPVQRIYDRCIQRYGRYSVTINPEDSVPLDMDIEKHIDNLVAAVRYVFIVIGPNWSGVDEYGRFRLSTADIPVQPEVLHALRSGKKIINVLVNGVDALPPRDRVPEELHGIYEQTTIVLRPDHLDEDLNQLVPPPTLAQRVFYWISLDWLNRPARN